uniref:Uncharacterized protein n=1 Tax=Anguilla anguilla TaxID=7936 RepID=A0A0E9SYB9_ANGAN
MKMDMKVVCGFIRQEAHSVMHTQAVGSVLCVCVCVCAHACVCVCVYST